MLWLRVVKFWCNKLCAVFIWTSLYIIPLHSHTHTKICVCQRVNKCLFIIHVYFKTEVIGVKPLQLWQIMKFMIVYKEVSAFYCHVSLVMYELCELVEFSEQRCGRRQQSFDICSACVWHNADPSADDTSPQWTALILRSFSIFVFFQTIPTTHALLLLVQWYKKKN